MTNSESKLSMSKDNNPHGYIKLWYFFLIFFVFIITVSTYANNSVFLIYLADIIIYLLVLTGKTEDDFYLYVSLIPVTNLLPTSIFRLYICIFISIIKILHEKKYKISKITLMAIIYFTTIFIIFDYLKGNNDSIATLLMMMIYILVFMDSKVMNRVEPLKLAWVVLISSLFIMTAMLYFSDGTLMQYSQATNIQYRLGEETRELGGAMSISLYGCIAIAAIYYLWNNASSLPIKLLLVASIVFIFLLELFSISRTFFTTVCIAFFLLGVKRLYSLKRILELIIFVLLFAFFALLIYTRFESLLLPMVNKLGIYLEEGQNSSRFGIWWSCIDYLVLHPIPFFIGGGTNTYMLSVSSAYKFAGYGAHSLYLDLLLSFGFTGTFLLILHYKKMLNTLQIYPNNSCIKREMDAMPLIIFLLSQLAQGSFRDLQSYVFPLVMIILMFKTKQKIERHI